MIADRFWSLLTAPSLRGDARCSPDAGELLEELAQAIIRLNEQHASTPVLVSPRYLSLQPPFFVALASQIHGHSGRSLRFDWHRRRSGLAAALTDRWAQLQAARINRALAIAAGNAPENGRCEIAITAMIGRPGGVHRKLIVGLCEEGAELPGWGTPIYLSGAAVGQPSFS